MSIRTVIRSRGGGAEIGQRQRDRRPDGDGSCHLRAAPEQHLEAQRSDD